METSLCFTPYSKDLSFKLHEKVVTDPGVALDLSGSLSTTSGSFAYRATLAKTVSTGPKVKGSYSKPLALTGGLGLSSDSNDQPFVTFAAAKSLALLEGPHTNLYLKGSCDYFANSNALSRKASVHVSHKVLDFTDKQDLKLTLGLDVDWPSSKDPKPSVYVQVRENNWTVDLAKGKWKFTYDL